MTFYVREKAQQPWLKRKGCVSMPHYTDWICWRGSKASVLLFSHFPKSGLDLCFLFYLAVLWKANVGFGKRLNSFPCLKRFQCTSPKVTISWLGSGMLLFLPTVAVLLFMEYLTFQWTSDLERERVQLGEVIKMKRVLLPCAWALTWETGNSPRNDWEYLIYPPKAVSKKIGRYILIDRDVLARVSKATK